MFEDTHLNFQLPTFIRSIDRVTIGLALVVLSGLIFVVYGVAHLLLFSQLKTQSTPGEILGISSVVSSIYVDVSGAVEQPGVYQLQSGDRLALALEKAGGLTVEADTIFVAKTLNLSQKVVDGEKIYIPWEGEGISSTEIEKPTTTNNSSLISINTASQTELETLPQVGEKRATDIIQNRPYSSLNELLDKDVVTETMFEEIKELIAL